MNREFVVVFVAVVAALFFVDWLRSIGRFIEKWLDGLPKKTEKEPRCTFHEHQQDPSDYPCCSGWRRWRQKNRDAKQ